MDCKHAGELVNLAPDSYAGDWVNRCSRKKSGWCRTAPQYCGIAECDGIAPCSLCGEPSGEQECGAAWYLCQRCAGTREAEAAGFTHNDQD